MDKYSTMITKNKKAFTLIELLVVIAIIGILSTLVIVSLGNSRASSRDAKRLNDLRAMANALELYYADNNSYPEAENFSPGATFEAGGVVYMNKIPNNPTPRTDGDCPDQEYKYIKGKETFTILTCLGSSTNNKVAGMYSLSPQGSNYLGTANGLVGHWLFNEGEGSTVFDYSGNGNNCTWSGSSTQRYDQGKVGAYAGKFISDEANCGTDILLQPDVFTVTAWVKYNIGTYFNVVTMSNSGTYPALYFRWSTRPLTYLNGSNYRYFSFTSFAQATNNWYFVSFVVTGNALDDIDNSLMYINGQLVSASTTLKNNSPVSKQVFKLGKTGFTDGLIDDVRLYNRVLTADEILAIYDGTK